MYHQEVERKEEEEEEEEPEPPFWNPLNANTNTGYIDEAPQVGASKSNLALYRHAGSGRGGPTVGGPRARYGAT